MFFLLFLFCRLCFSSFFFVKNCFKGGYFKCTLSRMKIAVDVFNGTYNIYNNIRCKSGLGGGESVGRL